MLEMSTFQSMFYISTYLSISIYIYGDRYVDI